MPGTWLQSRAPGWLPGTPAHHDLPTPLEVKACLMLAAASAELHTRWTEHPSPVDQALNNPAAPAQSSLLRLLQEAVRKVTIEPLCIP